MKEQSDILGRARVASPCGVSRGSARAAGLAFAALLSLCPPAPGQTKAERLTCERCGEVAVERRQSGSGAASLSGVVVDPNGAAVAGGDVVLRNEATRKKFRAQTSDEGRFSFERLPAGAYTFEVNWPGFRKLSVGRLKVGAGDVVSVRASLVVAEKATGILQVTSDAAPPVFGGGGGKTVLRGRALTNPPLPPR